jgi:hypothetical protein
VPSALWSARYASEPWSPAVSAQIRPPSAIANIHLELTFGQLFEKASREDCPQNNYEKQTVSAIRSELMKTVNKFVAAACAVLVSGAAFADEISKDAVIAAQKVWGEGIVAIASAHKDGSEDKGFAIKGWTNVRWENNGVYTSDDTAMAMGHYFFTGPDGKETKVEYSFGYIVDEEGELKINLHHSSLPYAPE